MHWVILFSAAKVVIYFEITKKITIFSTNSYQKCRLYSTNSYQKCRLVVILRGNDSLTYFLCSILFILCTTRLGQFVSRQQRWPDFDLSISSSHILIVFLWRFTKYSNSSIRFCILAIILSRSSIDKSIYSFYSHTS